MAAAAALRDAGHGDLVTYSRKVFIPLTELCRDVCHYCTYAKTPRRLRTAYLSPEQVLAIARAGQAAGCHEALFTLGDKPELRYRAAREALATLGYATTLDYLRAMAELVRRETGLLPHLNAGVMSRRGIQRLREVAPSMGIMLESASAAAHASAAGRTTARRTRRRLFACCRYAPLARPACRSPTGLLIGIGETRDERLLSLLALRDLHREYGHLQELIIQNFVPKPGTQMADAPEPAFDELLWTIAMARHVFGATMSIQAPPNLNTGRLADDHRRRHQRLGRRFAGHAGSRQSRIALAAARQPRRADALPPARRWRRASPSIRTTSSNAREWLHPGLVASVLRHADASGLARTDDWSPGAGLAATACCRTRLPCRRRARLRRSLRLMERARAGRGPRRRRDRRSSSRLRGADCQHLLRARRRGSRRKACGDTVTYVVNRNINYTNLCTYKCSFCAFSKGKTHEDLRGAPYVLDMERDRTAHRGSLGRGATEVCLQGGIHPAFTGQTYLDVLHAVKEAAPDMHVHAFSPLEVTQGAKTLGITLEAFLQQLQGRRSRHAARHRGGNPRRRGARQSSARTR